MNENMALFNQTQIHQYPKSTMQQFIEALPLIPTSEETPLKKSYIRYLNNHVTPKEKMWWHSVITFMEASSSVIGGLPIYEVRPALDFSTINVICLRVDYYVRMPIDPPVVIPLGLNFIADEKFLTLNRDMIDSFITMADNRKNFRGIKPVRESYLDIQAKIEAIISHLSRAKLHHTTLTITKTFMLTELARIWRKH